MQKKELKESLMNLSKIVSGRTALPIQTKSSIKLNIKTAEDFLILAMQLSKREPVVIFSFSTPLDFIAEITRHIPNKGEHTIRYYGFYSNKARGMRAKYESANSANVEVGGVKEDTLDRKVYRSRWAAMIQKVYVIDPLKCPKR